MTAGRNVNSFSHHWCTPPKYVAAVREMFDGVIELDPCSNQMSIVHAKREFLLPQEDGLKETWNYKTIYINPPYGADRERHTSIKDWLKKCAEAHEIFNSEILALIPVATNTSHWKKYIFGKAAAICFLYDTRLKFLIAGSLENKGAPMACCMVYWGPYIEKFSMIFSKFGAVADIRSMKDMNPGYDPEVETACWFDVNNY